MHNGSSMRGVGGIFLVVGLAWMAWRQRHFSGWVDDDAFISFRYARNWAEGHGLVFNPGERVEGYTNFLWTAILAVVHRLGIDLPGASQILGSILAVLTVLLLVAATRLLIPDGQQRDGGSRLVLVLLAPLSLAFTDSWAAWSVGGLENVCSALLVLGMFTLYFRILRSTATKSEPPPRRALLGCALVACLAILNHPSNALFVALVGLHVVLTARHRGWSPGTWLPFFVVLAVVLGAGLAARLAYYGEWLPNTWYAKGGSSMAVWERGARYLGAILAAQPLHYGVALLVFFTSLRRSLWRSPAMLLATATLLYTEYIVSVGGEEFPAFRSTIVLLPLFALLVPVVFDRWLLPRLQTPAPRWALALVTVLLFTVPMALSERVRRLDVAVAEGRTDLSRTAALMLKNQLPPETLFAHSGAGLIAFYTNFPWIDTLGLCDHHIARTEVTNLGAGAAGHEKGDGQYVWSRQPDFVMFPGYPISDRMPGTKTDKELWAIPEFHQRYRPIRVGFTFQSPQDRQPQQHSLFLYQRVD